MKQRLQKVLAAAGLGSRRHCERLIADARVVVDGTIAVLGSVVDPELQAILVDGSPVVAERKEYWLLNKRGGIITTACDPHGRPTVVDCVPSKARLFPVGRLDRDTTGLLLLTNDGELAARLLHPRYEVSKEYLALVRGRVAVAAVRALQSGVLLEDGRTAPAVVRVIARGESATELAISIHEGRKRQVRRMLESVGYPVERLHRRRFDGLTDAGLAPGESRPLQSEEIETLQRVAGLVSR